jgi:hypothetical protein
VQAQKKRHKKRALFAQCPFEFLAPQPGLEPGTYGLTVEINVSDLTTLFIITL